MVETDIWSYHELKCPCSLARSLSFPHIDTQIEWHIYQAGLEFRAKQGQAEASSWPISRSYPKHLFLFFVLFAPQPRSADNIKAELLIVIIKTGFFLMYCRQDFSY